MLDNTMRGSGFPHKIDPLITNNTVASLTHVVKLK